MGAIKDEIAEQERVETFHEDELGTMTFNNLWINKACPM